MNTTIIAKTELAEAPPAQEAEWELVLDETTDHGHWFVGMCDKATFTFCGPPEQIPGVEWLIKRAVSAMAKALLRQDGKLLRLQLYRLPSPWYRSEWAVVAWAHGSPGLPWAVIIPLFLVLLIGLVVAWTLRAVERTPWLGVYAVVLGAAGIAVFGGVMYALIRRR